MELLSLVEWRRLFQPEIVANYHCKIRNISRGADGNGKSSVASAAYRAGENIYNEREGKAHYFKGRSGDVCHKGIYNTRSAPEWSQSRSEFWNRVEVAERYKNARTAKEIIITLPYELNREQFLQPIEELVQDTIISKHDISVDVAIHRYGRAKKPKAKEVQQWRGKGLPFLASAEADQSDKAHVKILTNAHGAITGYKLYQPHAHILMPLRTFDENSKTGFAKKKNREIDSRQQVLLWRKAWQNSLNRQFERLGLTVRISCLAKKAANDNNPDDGETFDYQMIYQEAKKPEPEPISVKSLKAELGNRGKNVDTIVSLKELLRSENFESRLDLMNRERRDSLRNELYGNSVDIADEEANDRMFQIWSGIQNNNNQMGR